MNYTDILNLAISSILLIDAEAGGGKTTIFQFKMNDWGEGGTVMKSARYHYIFPMLFRNSNISSVKELIEKLIPNVSINIGTEDIMTLIADPSLEILFFCDGFDEKNENSHKVFTEICNLKERYKNIKVIVTSRPESVKEIFHTLGTRHTIEHIKILGIHESNRGELLKKYHDEMINAGDSIQKSEDLVVFYSNCSDRIKEIYRLPINLVILAYLWATSPDIVKTIKSGAGLYSALVDILSKMSKRFFSITDLGARVGILVLILRSSSILINRSELEINLCNISYLIASNFLQ